MFLVNNRRAIIRIVRAASGRRLNLLRSGSGFGGTLEMKILLVHNYYRTGTPGGEDVVFQQERDLLAAAGHEVTCYTRSNDEMNEQRPIDRLRVVWSMRRSARTRRELSQLISQVRPDVAHFHNTFPLISASGYEACAAAGVPVVQTVHNFRLVCSAATHFRAGMSCERCTAGDPWPAVRHACYRGSRLASLAVASTIHRNHRVRTRRDPVSMYLALTRFAAGRLMSAGIPAGRIAIKPNFVDLPGDAASAIARSDRFVFVGRLAEEKGVRVLLDAWRGLPDIPLLVVGDGPLRGELEAYARQYALQVEFVGARERGIVQGLVRSARAAIVPSLCFEGGVPLTLLEALAAGTPVVASRLGGIPELVTHGADGLLFEAGDAGQLAAQARRLNADPLLRTTLAESGLQTVQRVHGRQASLDALVGLYAAVGGAHRSSP